MTRRQFGTTNLMFTFDGDEYDSRWSISRWDNWGAAARLGSWVPVPDAYIEKRRGEPGCPEGWYYVGPGAYSGCEYGGNYVEAAAELAVERLGKTEPIREETPAKTHHRPDGCTCPPDKDPGYRIIDRATGQRAEAGDEGSAVVCAGCKNEIHP